MRRPLAVALTGGIAAGKSEALLAFARHGAVTASSDEVNVQILEVDAERRRLSLSLKRVEDGMQVQPKPGEDAPPPALDLSEDVFTEEPAADEAEEAEEAEEAAEAVSAEPVAEEPVAEADAVEEPEAAADEPSDEDPAAA